LQAAHPSQFSAFEYGFFAAAPKAPPPGQQSELMECLEDLNQLCGCGCGCGCMHVIGVGVVAAVGSACNG
jgi:hypothetical protein